MTRRLHLLLLRLLAVLLITQGVAAPAHCLERLARATSTPICTGGDGLRYGPGEEPDHPLAHHGADGCAMCHNPPQGPVPQALALPVPSVVLATGTPGWRPGQSSTFGQDAGPYSARAPPVA
jgi:hypothetical protein